MHRNTHLCDIQMEDQTVLRVHCLVEGAIIERNHNLTIDKIGKPEGYIVVIMPKKRYKPDMKESV